VTPLRSSSKTWLRRLPALAVIAAYLGASGWYFYRHALGDTAAEPAAYLFTWDMFPNYPSWSARRIAVAQTQGGRYLRIFPSRGQQFRLRRDRSHSRFDLPRSDAALQRAVDETLRSHWPIDADDPVVYVFLLEHYWPARFNLPDDLYESAYGEPNPRRRYWRVIAESAVTDGGRTRWTGPGR
jgi:hypothetical protein